MIRDLTAKDVARIDALISLINPRYGDGEIQRAWDMVKKHVRKPAQLQRAFDLIGDGLAVFIVCEIISLYDPNFDDRQLYAEIESALGRVARDVIWAQNAVATALREFPVKESTNG